MDVFVCLYMIQIESNKDFKNKFYGKSKSWPEKKIIIKNCSFGSKSGDKVFHKK